MTAPFMNQRAREGDLIEIHGHHVGERGQVAEIVSVLGELGHEHYLVRWEDGRESILYPGGDATIRRAQKAGRP